MTEIKGHAGYLPYEPQLSPVEWGESVWIVEGPVVAYRTKGLTIPCPTRMTVIRLSDGGLWLHSPVAYSSALDAALEKLGQITALVAPNSQHHLNIGDWATAHPAADIFTVAQLANRFAGSRRITCEDWNEQILSTMVEKGEFQEAIFFHPLSRTLIVTDLMQRFEPERIGNPFVRLLLRMARATGPTASPSKELWPSTDAQRQSLTGGFRQMLDWKPDKIILAHGACVSERAIDEIEHAFHFLKRR